MLRRRLTVDWAKELGSIDLRNHSAGIGGVHSMPPPAPVVEAMAAIKPRMIRIFLQEFFYIYPDHGVFDWSKMDAYMDAVHAMGADIMASICIKPKVLFPEVDQKVFMPNNIAEWQEVIRAMVLRYSKEKSYVTHWAIANETNIGEWGGCPYLIESPDDFYEYYKITAAPIREVLPNVKVGGPSYAGARGGAEYLGRFTELCKLHNEPLDFTCYNMYSNNPDEHKSDARGMRDAIDKHLPGLPFYMTEFNIGIGEDMSIEEKAYDPKRAAGQAASILAFHEDGALDGTFQYHIYDQWNDPREFAPFYGMTRYMAEHWNDKPHRLGLLDLDGKTRPQYFLYKWLYETVGQRVQLDGTDNILCGFASHDNNEKLTIFLTNYTEIGTPEALAVINFANAPAGSYRMNVYRMDKESAAVLKITDKRPLLDLPPAESRMVYAHPDFYFNIFTPADSVTLIRFDKVG